MGEFSKEILKSPLISFIVINYNGGEYLSQCLSSIMEQGGDSECIVIDNCSSDDSLEIIKRFNVYLVVNKKNLGYPIAVNQGIKKAKGKFESGWEAKIAPSFSEGPFYTTENPEINFFVKARARDINRTPVAIRPSIIRKKEEENDEKKGK